MDNLPAIDLMIKGVSEKAYQYILYWEQKEHEEITKRINDQLRQQSGTERRPMF